MGAGCWYSYRIILSLIMCALDNNRLVNEYVILLLMQNNMANMELYSYRSYGHCLIRNYVAFRAQIYSQIFFFFLLQPHFIKQYLKTIW